MVKGAWQMRECHGLAPDRWMEGQSPALLLALTGIRHLVTKVVT